MSAASLPGFLRCCPGSDGSGYLRAPACMAPFCFFGLSLSFASMRRWMARSARAARRAARANGPLAASFERAAGLRAVAMTGSDVMCATDRDQRAVAHRVPACQDRTDEVMEGAMAEARVTF